MASGASSRPTAKELQSALDMTPPGLQTALKKAMEEMPKFSGILKWDVTSVMDTQGKMKTDFLLSPKMLNQNLGFSLSSLFVCLFLQSSHFPVTSGLCM